MDLSNVTPNNQNETLLLEMVKKLDQIEQKHTHKTARNFRI